uniref:Amino acid transporter n=1 Tax=Ditylenchus dipsaci TaxID=166011 RepID=A0A915E8N4_9BILA
MDAHRYDSDVGRCDCRQHHSYPCSVGAAAVPGAAMITLMLVLTSVGLPTSQVSLIFTVDWLLDRACTSVNILEMLWALESFTTIQKRTLPLSMHKTPLDGASAGSLIASLLAFNQKPEVFQAAKEDMFKIAREISARGHWQSLYSLSPHVVRGFVENVFRFRKWNDYPLAEKLAGILEKFIPRSKPIL